MSLEFDVLKGKKLLLASASPRRRELLGKLDVAVSQAHLKQVDENYPTDMPAEDVPAYISQKKAAEGCKMSLRGYQNWLRLILLWCATVRCWGNRQMRQMQNGCSGNCRDADIWWLQG